MRLLFAGWTERDVEATLGGTDHQDVPYIASVVGMDASGYMPGPACDLRLAVQ